MTSENESKYIQIDFNREESHLGRPQDDAKPNAATKKRRLKRIIEQPSFQSEAEVDPEQTKWLSCQLAGALPVPYLSQRISHLWSPQLETLSFWR